MKFDGAAFGREIVNITRSFVERALSPVLERLKALEDRPSGLTEKEVEARIAAAVEKAKAEVESREVAAGLALKALADRLDALPAAPTAEQVAALVPAGKDGRDGVDGKDGRDGEKGDPGRDGVDGRDGVGLADALTDRDGNLVLTMTNGTMKSLGVVVGRDGKDGAPGSDGVPGKDGINGADGVIKLDLADVHKGPWKAGAFERGNLVTMGGHTWLAMANTESRPGTDESWRMIVRAGRDGKDGRDLSPAPPATVRA